MVIAVDDSVPSTAALEWTLRQFPDATITILHVIDADKPDGSIRQRVLSSEYEAHRIAAEDAASTILENAQAYADSYEIAVTTVTRYGRPIRQIVAYTEANEIDMLVMGTHRRSGLSRLLLGSVSELVMQRSSVPVTTVPDLTPVERTETSLTKHHQNRRHG